MRSFLTKPLVVELFIWLENVMLWTGYISPVWKPWDAWFSVFYNRFLNVSEYKRFKDCCVPYFEDNKWCSGSVCTWITFKFALPLHPERKFNENFIIIQIKIWISYQWLSHNTDFEIARASLFENYCILRYYITR